MVALPDPSEWRLPALKLTRDRNPSDCIAGMLALSERERQHPGTPNEQNDTGRIAEPMAGADSFFEQNEQGDARDPVEIHHPTEK